MIDHPVLVCTIGENAHHQRATLHECWQERGHQQPRWDRLQEQAMESRGVCLACGVSGGPSDWRTRSGSTSASDVIRNAPAQSNLSHPTDRAQFQCRHTGCDAKLTRAAAGAALGWVPSACPAFPSASSFKMASGVDRRGIHRSGVVGAFMSAPEGRHRRRFVLCHLSVVLTLSSDLPQQLRLGLQRRGINLYLGVSERSRNPTRKRPFQPSGKSTWAKTRSFAPSWLPPSHCPL